MVNVSFATNSIISDCEGHLGFDKRFYLLDLARCFPPEYPSEVTHLPVFESAIFCRLLRPELLKRLRAQGFVPLNPDALSRWGAADPSFAEQNENVRKATQTLVQNYIPQFAEWLDANGSTLAAQTMKIAVEFHRNGINIRHMGLVRSLTKTYTAKTVLLVNMVARTLKNMLRDWLRRETQRVYRTAWCLHLIISHLPFMLKCVCV